MKLPFKRQNDKVLILGFAPCRQNAPYKDPTFDKWGLNEVYLLYEGLEKSASAWFQLHGKEPPKYRDPNHKEVLSAMPGPVLMWEPNPDLPTAVAYPHDDIVNHFGRYFTNTVSWMLALAIAMDYKEIHIHGINMATDEEFGSQRPSVEFFLGWARGLGIKIVTPPDCDLLTTWFEYGYQDPEPYIVKMDARRGELENRRAEVQAEVAKRQRERGTLMDEAAQLEQQDMRLLGRLDVLESQNDEESCKPIGEERTKIRQEIIARRERIAVLDNEIGGMNAWDQQLIGALDNNEAMRKLGPPRLWSPGKDMEPVRNPFEPRGRSRVFLRMGNPMGLAPGAVLPAGMSAGGIARQEAST